MTRSSYRTSLAAGRRLTAFALAAASAAWLSTIAGVSLAAAAEAVPFHPLLAGRSPSDRAIAASPTSARGLRDLGRAPANTPVRIGILLRYQHEAELEQLARMQGDRTSAYYHHYLTTAQWNAYFAPTPRQFAYVAAALRRAGFIVDQRVVANRGYVAARGPSAAAERYFHTRIDRVLQNGRVRYANVTGATMPDEIRAESVVVAGLQSIEAMHTPHATFYPFRGSVRAEMATAAARVPAATRLTNAPRVRDDATPKPITDATPSPNPNPDPTIPPIVAVTTVLDSSLPSVPGVTGDYAPYGMAVAYDFPVLQGWNGNGRSAGSVINADVLNSDLNGYIKAFGLPRPLLPATGDDALTHRVRIDGGSTAPTEGEETLDAEAIIGLSPGTNFYEYLTPALNIFEVLNAYNQVDSDDIVDTLNSSFGECETDDPTNASYGTDYLALQGAAKGITYSASTGDTGGLACNVVMNGVPGTAPGIEAPASGYYFTAIGGTAVILNPTTGAVINEMGWIDGGGGVSKLNPLPDWQMTTIANATADGNTGTFLSPAATSGRNTPDMALYSDQQVGQTNGGFAIYYNGELEGVGGTSLASPLWIAMQTEIDEIQNSKNGWVVPRLYSIYNTNGYVQFRDVTTGSNETYVNVAGYDNITGIGVPLGFELAGTE